MMGEIDKRYGKMMFTAMRDTGHKKRYMQDAMNVSGKTIYNWENGYSYPTIKQLAEWFDIIGADLIVYWNYYFNADQTESDADDKKIKRQLHDTIDQYTPRRRALLHFILCGKHGADMDGLINLTVCYLQTQWKDRIVQAAMILSNYRLNRELKKHPISPNCDLISKSIQSCSESYIAGKEGYRIKQSEKIK